MDVSTFGPIKSKWRNILQEYRLLTKAADDEKRNFAELLAEVWQRLFTSEHVQAGFHGTGLCPLDPSAIYDEKLAPSLLPQLSEGSPDRNNESPSQQSDMERAKSDTFEAIPPVTPLKMHLREHFAAILQCTRPTGPQLKGQVKPRQYGEVLIADEVIERVEQQEEEQKRKKKEKRTAKKTKKARTAEIDQPCTG